MNKLYRFTGTAIAAVTIAASAVAFSAPYAAAQTVAHQAAATPAASPGAAADDPRSTAGAGPATSTANIKTVFSHNWAGYAVHRSGVKFRESARRSSCRS